MKTKEEIYNCHHNKIAPSLKGYIKCLICEKDFSFEEWERKVFERKDSVNKDS